jgi:hypothetical protein
VLSLLARHDCPGNEDNRTCAGITSGAPKGPRRRRRGPDRQDHQPRSIAPEKHFVTAGRDKTLQWTRVRTGQSRTATMFALSGPRIPWCGYGWFVPNMLSRRRTVVPTRTKTVSCGQSNVLSGAPRKSRHRSRPDVGTSGTTRFGRPAATPLPTTRTLCGSTGATPPTCEPPVSRQRSPRSSRGGCRSTRRKMGGYGWVGSRPADLAGSPPSERIRAR